MAENNTPIRWALQSYFLLTSLVVIFARVIPSLRRSFIPYGKTLASRQQRLSLLEKLANITVPKNWFWHYYFLSMSLSVFWGYRALICSTGNSICLLQILSRIDGTTAIVWAMMFVQGCRRLYESLFIQRKSTARMWIGHYIVGCAFYTAMSFTVFIDGRQRPPGAFRVNFN